MGNRSPKEENRPNTTSYMIQENSSEIECVKHLLKKISGYLQISTMDDKHQCTL